MPALKRFLCSLLTLCSLPILAADSTIGNLSAKTTIPNNYVMPWEDPAVQDWHITFLNLTNQILSGYAPTGMLSGYLPLTGGTVSGAVLSTSSSTNAPVRTELATAGWVRGLFSGGTLLYNTTNLHPVDTNWYSATPFTNSTAQVRTYAGVTNNQYLGTGIMSTQAFTTIYSPMTVNTYMSYNTGGARAATVKPELYYVYTDKANGALTNLLGDYDCGGQALIAGTNLYTFTIPFPTIISTNATGFYGVCRFKVVSQNANPDVSIHGSGSTPSHISFSTPGTSAGDVTAAGNNTFAGTNTFTKPIYLSNSGTNTITLDPVTGTVTASNFVGNVSVTATNLSGGATNQVYTQTGWSGDVVLTNLTATNIIKAYGGLESPGAGGTTSTRLGQFAIAGNTYTIGIGYNVGAGGLPSTATCVGALATATGTTGASALGYGAKANNTSSTAIGASALCYAASAIVIGANATNNVTETGNITIGNKASTTATGGGYNVTIGYMATNAAWRGTAIGAQARVDSVSATAIGRGAWANVAHGIAIGRGSWTDSSTNNAAIGGSGTASMELWINSGHTSRFIDVDGATNNIDPSAGAITIHGFDGYDALDGTSNNIPGGTLVLQAGVGTGTASGGNIFLKTSSPGASSNNTKNAARAVLSILSNGQVVATNGYTLTQLPWIPTNAIPASSSLITNYVLVNLTNTINGGGPMYVATNFNAAGSFILLKPTFTQSNWP